MAEAHRTRTTLSQPQQDLPLSGLAAHRWTYQGPGWQEWLYSFAVTGLTASTIISMSRPQGVYSAMGYYYKEPNVLLIQKFGIAINALVLLAVVAWIIRWRKKVPWSWVPSALAAAGIGLIWWELTLAIEAVAAGPYTLSGLPNSPIHSAGTIGVMVHIAYLVIKMPLGKIKTGWKALIKLSLLAAAWPVQQMIWESLKNSPS
jgi:hypothetical protein